MNQVIKVPRWISFERSPHYAKNSLSREVFSAVAEMGTDAFNSSIDP